MDIFKVSGIALLAGMLILLLKELRGSFAVPMRLSLTLFLFGGTALLYLPVAERIRALFSLSDAEKYAAPLLRAAGIGLVAECTASLCRDLGENSAAEGVLLFGKAEILLLSLPLLDELLELVKEFTGW